MSLTLKRCARFTTGSSEHLFERFEADRTKSGEVAFRVNKAKHTATAVEEIIYTQQSKGLAGGSVSDSRYPTVQDRIFLRRQGVLDVSSRQCAYTTEEWQLAHQFKQQRRLPHKLLNMNIFACRDHMKAHKDGINPQTLDGICKIDTASVKRIKRRKK